MTVYLHTQGCKVNQYESQAMRELLIDSGYDVNVFSPGMDDIGNNVILINSCTVTGESDRKLRQFIRRCKREHPTSIILLTGCYSQAFPNEVAALKEVDIVTGNASRNIIPSLLSQFLATKQKIINVFPHPKEYEPLCIHSFDERTRAFLKIQDGCNCFCSYCIIPYARGRIRSTTLDCILSETQFLAAKGYKEIVLTGINLTAFGAGCDYDLADAIHIVASVPGIERVRLGSLEPDDMTPTLIQKMAKEPKLCPQFHLSLQSGCTETLKRMNRHYTADEYRTVCNHLRETFPNCALTTDIMVGFAGETEEEFEKSFQFVKEIGFSKIHVFPYSIRPGTIAAKMDGQNSNEIKNNRCRKMIAMGQQKQEEFLKQLIGKTVEVLTETTAPEGYTDGFTPNYSPVRISSECAPNQLILVKIKDVQNNLCIAELIQQRKSQCE